MKDTATQTTYLVRDSEGVYHNIFQEELVTAAQDCIKERFQKGETLTSPEASAKYFQVLIGDKEHEVFTVLWLDTKHQVIGHSELFRGTIDGASIYPREVVKDGLAHNAAAVILAHNHPSGSTEPSTADIKITKRLKEALALIDIRVLDHIIVGDTTASMAEQGLV
ncbi:MAG: DNA repair protein RadC [Gammaproteobacteria bacterium]|nr:DNA repair protein RadC [Gammaproteobacteria bacterium]